MDFLLIAKDLASPLFFYSYFIYWYLIESIGAKILCFLERHVSSSTRNILSIKRLKSWSLKISIKWPMRKQNLTLILHYFWKCMFSWVAKMPFFQNFVHVDISLTPSLPNMDNRGHLVNPLLPSSCPRGYWMPTYCLSGKEHNFTIGIRI